MFRVLSCRGVDLDCCKDKVRVVVHSELDVRILQMCVWLDRSHLLPFRYHRLNDQRDMQRSLLIPTMTDQTRHLGNEQEPQCIRYNNHHRGRKASFKIKTGRG